MNTFYKLIGNVFCVVTMTNFLWFSLTFWVYLSTNSVIATGILGGIYALLSAISSFSFGYIVDRFNKKHAMAGATILSMILFGAALLVFLSTPIQAFSSISNPILWLLVILILSGSILGSIHTIATSTLITILVPKDRQDKANGLYGTMTGFSFAINSLLSGLAIGFGGLGIAIILSICGLGFSLLYLFSIKLDAPNLHIPTEQKQIKLDAGETIKMILSVPGLAGLIFFTTFNNFVGGVFMALMDAYGLSLMSVEYWGLFWGVLSFGFILGGLYISKYGLGKKPVRTLMIVNMVIWIACILFPIQQSIPLLAIGVVIWMALFPFIEATEQTIIQRVVPYNQQARVFGFAHSIEQSASPITAFVIGPLTQTFFIPFMTTGRGVDLIGSWFGIGDSRGIALVFISSGIFGAMITIVAWKSAQYMLLTKTFQES
jgi:MFS transporter, DHA3 family, multidrug efflux protein